MKIRKFIIISLFFFTTISFLEGQVDQIKFDELLGYKNVVVTKIEPDGIRIRHDSGMKRLTFEDLPEDVRVKLNLNEAAAQEYRKQLQSAEAEAAKAERTKSLKSAELQRASYLRFTVKGSIKQVYPNGVVLDNVSAFRITQQKIPYEVKVDGPTGLDPNRKVITETRFKIGKAPEYKKLSSKLVFVKCDTSKLKDSTNPDFKIEAYEVGDFIYRGDDISGFSVDPADAGKKMEVKID